MFLRSGPRASQKPRTRFEAPLCCDQSRRRPPRKPTNQTLQTGISENGSMPPIAAPTINNTKPRAKMESTRTTRLKLCRPSSRPTVSRSEDPPDQHTICGPDRPLPLGHASDGGSRRRTASVGTLRVGRGPPGTFRNSFERAQNTESENSRLGLSNKQDSSAIGSFPVGVGVCGGVLPASRSCLRCCSQGPRPSLLLRLGR